ncbi:kinase-associated lipoprotein B [Bacillus atrophaeus]|uniref:kinase-associated lipoprotein B n=1 Tax=Bacillus atrophaeus TaxID=1452 RepID=UPI00077AFFEC|nr:kinase-associated lipoprotein B [Bacillus atrophaeus]KXZ19897.1 kinase [Bacillus atrophaeus]MCY7945647.1 kinase-associated lipoprotein B [Bacillus atrophaeus]MCY8096481.1 kinase-associated lipoprotein B [Bacillus atrophaeus]MCY8466086.1 kinase-associated lipoprotein B [Bacillus atrophaeus]MCY8477967.1 kinase-associated lipoprotein B [Bacillus atrophaeus]
MSSFEIGSLVKGFYKTGVYIGEITDCRPQHYLVKIKAVLTHPTQGDLHHPKQADVPFFHERRALAFGEQTNITHQMVKPYEGEVPDYKESLEQAVSRMKERLNEDGSEWAKRSLQNMNVLEKEYFNRK